MTGFRLIAQSNGRPSDTRPGNRTEHTSNARVKHLETAYGSRVPRCASSGDYRRLHMTHPDVRELPKCDGCFNGRNVHK